jgi:hypothetical protein
MCLFWLVRSLGVRIFELRCLGVRNFGWLVRSLGVRIFGLRCLVGSEFWVYGILASWVFGCPDSWVYCTPGSSDSSAHLDLRLSVRMFAAGRMVLRFFLGSHGTLGSCFRAVYDASTRLGHSNECSLYVL